MKQQDLNQMIERAKTKKNGVYPYKTYYYYLVIDGQVSAWSDFLGEIHERSYGFNVSKGKAKDRFEAKEILKGYLKQFNS